MAQESVLRIVIDSRNAERNARNVANELQNIERNGDHASQSMDSMSVATRQLAGYMAGVVTVGAAIGKMDTYTGIQNQLKLVTDSQAELNSAMKETFAIAQRSRSSWESVTTVYQKLAMNAKEIGLAQSDISKLTETVSKGIALSGSSAEGAASAITQLGQALGNGQLRGDEFNAVMENGYGLMRLLAEGMGVPIGQLKAMAEAGELTSEKVTKALLSMSSTADAEYAKTDATIKQSISELGNAITKFTGESGQASGAAQILTSSISMLGQNLEAVANIAVIGGVALLTKTIATQTVAIHGSITAVVARRAADTAALQSQIQLTAVEVQRTRQVAALALTEINLARQELNSATTRQARAAATMRLTQAEVAHNIALKQSAAAVATQVTAEENLAETRTAGARALALVGGPIGAITIGVTALAAGYMLLSNNSNESTKSLRENNEAVGDAIVKYRELNGIQRDAQMAAERQKLEDLNEAYRKASAELMVYASNMSSMGEVVTESQIELSTLFAEYKKTGDLNAFNTAVQNSSKISQDAKDKTANLAKAVFEAGSTAKTQKEFIAQLSGELNGTANAGNNAAAGVRNLASALSEVNTKLSADVFSAKLQNAFEKQGKSSQSAARWTEVYNENAKKGFKGVTVEQKKMLDQLDAVDKQREARQKAAQASASASTKASKAALTQQKKDAKEADRLKEEQYDLRERIAYDYKDRILKIEKDLENEISDIQKAKFSPKDTAGYIQNAQRRADLEKELYTAQLQQEYNDWHDSEEKKLDRKVYVNELMIQLDRDMNDEIKAEAIQSLKDQSNHEIGLIKLAKEQRIFQAEQAMMTEIQAMQKRYALEREEIIRTTNDLEERKRKLDALNTNTIRGSVGKNFSDPDDTGSQFLQSVSYAPIPKSNIQRLDEEFAKEREQMLANFENVKQLNAGNHEAILEAERQFLDAKQQLQDEYDFKAQDARKLDIENQLAVYGQMVSAVSTTFSDMMSIVSQVKDENSKTYKTIFALNKAAAFAQAIINTEEGATKALAQGGTLGPALAMIVRASGYASAGIIAGQALAGPSGNGYADGGFTGIGGKFDPAGIVHKGEVVWSQEDIKRWGGVNVVEAMRTSQPPKGYSDGGLVTPKDTYRVGMGTVDAINRGADVQAERQAQANVRAQAASPQPIESNVRVGIFDDRDDMMNQMYGREGEKVVMYHLKRNGMLKA
jgi:tape measure domain-containing protein